MIELALKARIPVIGVYSDDPLNQERVLGHLSARKPTHLPITVTTHIPLPNAIYWAENNELKLTPQLYRDFEKAGNTLVLFNYTPGPMIFDAGILTAPSSMVRMEVMGLVQTSKTADEVMAALKGLSIKTVREVLALTAARTGALTANAVRQTRASITTAVQGLYPVDTSYDFYDCPAKIKQWMDLNEAYFNSTGTHPKLMPRGLLLDGDPGVGKSMAAKGIAQRLQVPLYRLDLASALDKYIGVSENRVAKILMLVEKEAPAVLMLDEVEKIFGNAQAQDTGTTQRILSQLLWWLSEHRAQVLTIMTTNDKAKIPKELYRSGRIDEVITIDKLTLSEAKLFATRSFISILSAGPNMEQQVLLAKAVEGSPAFKHTVSSQMGGGPKMAHAEVVTLVSNLIKREGWDKAKTAQKTA